MLNRWISFGLLMLTVTIGLLGWNWYSNPWQPSSSAPQSPSELATATLTAPPVNAQRLLADLAALATPRFREGDRDRARQYITRALEEAGWATQTQAFTAANRKGINLYASRPGTDPQAATVILAAHYDTVEDSPGADDNATSVATVLEVARLLQSQPTARTLQVVFFDLEEAGLLGSEAFVAQVIEPATLQGAIVLDMVGYTCAQAGCQSYPPQIPIQPPIQPLTDRGTFLAVLGDQAHAQLLTAFEQTSDLPPILTLPVPTLHGVTPDLVRSDHAPFWQRGLGAVLVTDTANFRNPHYHQSSDRLDTIDQDFFLGAAQIVLKATASLLKSPSGVLPPLSVQPG